MNKLKLVGALLLLVSILSSSCDSKPKPAPTEPAPTEQAPAEPASSEVAPNEQAPIEQTPTEEAPAEPAPTEESPTELPPAETAPTEESSDAQAPLDDSVKDAKLEYLRGLQASINAAVEQKDMDKARQLAQEIQKVASEINAPGDLSKTNEESPEPTEPAEENAVVAQSNEEETPAPAEAPEPAATPEPATTADSNSLYEAEIARLVEQLNKEKAQAVAPIQKRFDMAAQLLLRKVTQSGNLEAAIKLKEVIEDAEELADFKDEAKTPQDKELARLVDQRDKAAAIAAGPAERRFDLATQQLIRKATQSGDLDAAIKLKEMIAEAKNTADSAPVEAIKKPQISDNSDTSSSSSKVKKSSEKDFEYKFQGESVEITKYIGKSNRVSVPAMIQGLPVTSVGRYAFNNSEVKEVLLPDTIKILNDYAFYRCTKL